MIILINSTTNDLPLELKFLFTRLEVFTFQEFFVGGAEGATLRNGRLSDLAPTLLGLMGLDLPPEMTGQSLIR